MSDQKDDSPNSSNGQIDMKDSGPDLKTTSDQIDHHILPTWRLVLLTISLCCGLFLSLLDTSIVATALYSIGKDFGSTNSITWVALAYTLAYLGCAVIFARIADIIGRRDAFIGAFVIFLSFSLGCGLSQSLNQLISCRALQGIGGSGLYALSMIIFPEITPPKQAKWIASLVGTVLALSGVLGPLLGGAITNTAFIAGSASWRWIFLINAPIGVGPLILFAIAWPKQNQIHHVERRPLRELDVLGCILLIAASVLVVFALEEGGISPGAWSSALFIGPVTIGCCCWVLFFGWEATIARFFQDSIGAIFPMRLVKNRAYITAAISTLLAGFPYFVVIYSLPIRFQVVNHMSPLMSGVGLLPMLASTAIGSMIGGLINGKKNNTFPTLIIAACLMTLGSGLLSTLSNTPTPEPKTYGFQVFMGLGFGLTVSTVSIIAALECEIRDHAVAQGIIAQNRVLGGSIGIAASSAILAAAQQRDILSPGIMTSAQLASLASPSAAALFTPEQLHAVTQTYTDVFTEDMRLCCAVTGFCLLVTMAMFRRHPPGVEEMRKKQLRDNAERLAGLRHVQDGVTMTEGCSGEAAVKERHELALAQSGSRSGGFLV